MTPHLGNTLRIIHLKINISLKRKFCLGYVYWWEKNLGDYISKALKVMQSNSFVLIIYAANIQMSSCYYENSPWFIHRSIHVERLSFHIRSFGSFFIFSIFIYIFPVDIYDIYQLLFFLCPFFTPALTGGFSLKSRFFFFFFFFAVLKWFQLILLAAVTSLPLLFLNYFLTP